MDDERLCYNEGMKHKRKGFTLIEIVLFLAITGLLFVGIIVGTNNSIGQQRFTDSVQNFAEVGTSLPQFEQNTFGCSAGAAGASTISLLVPHSVQNFPTNGAPQFEHFLAFTSTAGADG